MASNESTRRAQDKADGRRRAYLRIAPLVAIAVAGVVLVGLSIQSNGSSDQADVSKATSTPSGPAKSEDPGLARRTAGDP
ncbi:hypothetical protein, partial [Kribbella sp.]|uniref:hypothetical protein n=1 Tax=Kribbella sp. TaxID=1871183 RepID=UPI002D358D9D